MSSETQTAPPTPPEGTPPTDLDPALAAAEERERSVINTARQMGNLALHSTFAFIGEQRAKHSEKRAANVEQAGKFHSELGETALDHMVTPTRGSVENLTNRPRSFIQERRHNKMVKKSGKDIRKSLEITRREAVFGTNFGHGEVRHRGLKVSVSAMRHNREKTQYRRELRRDYAAGRITRKELNDRMEYLVFGSGKRPDHFEHPDVKAVRDARKSSRSSRKHFFNKANRTSKKGDRQLNRAKGKRNKAARLRSKVTERNTKREQIRQELDS